MARHTTVRSTEVRMIIGIIQNAGKWYNRSRDPSHAGNNYHLVPNGLIARAQETPPAYNRRVKSEAKD